MPKIIEKEENKENPTTIDTKKVEKKYDNCLNNNDEFSILLHILLKTPYDDFRKYLLLFQLPCVCFQIIFASIFPVKLN